MVIPKQEPKDQFRKKLLTVIKQRLIVCSLFEEVSLHFIKEMAKSCQLKQKQLRLLLKNIWCAQERIRYQKLSKIKTRYILAMSEDAYQEFRSAPKLLLLLEERPYQDIKKRSRHQDKTRLGHALLACLDGSCSDGWLARKLCLDWIGKFSSG